MQMSEGRPSLPIEEAGSVQSVADYVNIIPAPFKHAEHDVRPSPSLNVFDI